MISVAAMATWQDTWRLEGYVVTGIDASETGIVLARKHYPTARFIHSELTPRLVYESEVGEFDLVVSTDVIEHLYRPSDLIETANALLKPGGHFIVTTPYHGYLKNLALAVTGKWDAHLAPLEDGGHIKFFSVRTISALIRKHGFTDLRFDYFGRAPWLWMNIICQARKG